MVQYSLYNATGRLSVQSVKYYVAAYTGTAGSAAYSIPDSTVTAQTTYTYDGLGRTTQVIDALSFLTTTSYGIICAAPGTTSGDTSCYEQTLVLDANHHQTGTLADGLGRSIYAQEYTGTVSGAYAVYATTTYGYDAAGHVTSILYPDGVHSATSTYDDAGRLASTSDPDRGTEYDCYDNNGNLVLHADARSSGNGTSTCTNGPPNNAGTTYTGYDSLNRPIWRNSTNTATGAYATWSYVASGNGTGQLAGETFNTGASLGAGSYAYTYDVRGQQTGQSITLGGTSYTFSSAYNDAGEPTSLTYSDGEVATYGYDGASGALTSLVTQPSGGATSVLYSAIAYGGTARAAGLPTTATLGSGNGSPLTYQAVYDYNLRLSRSRLTKGVSTLFASDRTYDGVGNVASVQTTLPGGTDTQAFCYDEQNRLTWAGSTGTAPCAGSVPAGTLPPSAQYTQTYSYGTQNQLTNGPLGTYTYGDSAHIDAATAIGGSSYTASYDASGNMTCRAPTSSQTCSGQTPTGQGLTYDNEGRLTGWTGGSGSTATEAMAYDGEGHRVALSINGSTPTYYLGNLEEVGSGGNIREQDLSAGGGGLPVVVRMPGNGTPLAYVVSDGLGSVSEALDGSGTVTFQQLFTPYGASRFSTGTPLTTDPQLVHYRCPPSAISVRACPCCAPWQPTPSACTVQREPFCRTPAMATIARKPTSSCAMLLNNRS